MCSPDQPRAAVPTLERAAISGQAVLRRVYVEKTLPRKSGRYQFTLLNNTETYTGERSIDLVLPCPQSPLGNFAKVAPIDGTERLEPMTRARHRDHRVRFPGRRQKKREQLPGDKGHVHREHQIQIGRRMLERGVNTTQGPAS